MSVKAKNMAFHGTGAIGLLSHHCISLIVCKGFDKNEKKSIPNYGWIFILLTNLMNLRKVVTAVKAFYSYMTPK
jgi:hypothetical protein